MDLNSLQPGERVVVRYRIEPDPEPLTDAIGTVVSLLTLRPEADVEPSDTASLPSRMLTLETRKGEVSIDSRSIVAIKRVPPAPPRRSATPNREV